MIQNILEVYQPTQQRWMMVMEVLTLTHLEHCPHGAPSS